MVVLVCRDVACYVPTCHAVKEVVDRIYTKCSSLNSPNPSKEEDLLKGGQIAQIVIHNV